MFDLVAFNAALIADIKAAIAAAFSKYGKLLAL
jgi:hypothetical protein